MPKAVARSISKARLAPYLARCDDHLKTALTLYSWNIEISQAAYSALHVVEVFLRNAMDEQLRTWNASVTDAATGLQHSGDWLLDPSDLIRQRVGDKIDEASSRAKRAIYAKTQTNALPEHDDILAQTSFGLWKFFMPSENDYGKKKIWEEGLCDAFPNTTTADERRKLVSAVNDAHKLRNRIAHLEPVYEMHMPAYFGNMELILKSIDVKCHAWFTGKALMSAAWEKRPAVLSRSAVSSP